MPDRKSGRSQTKSISHLPQFAARTASSSEQRRIGSRAERLRFLIICEGEKTEPLYFRGFHQPGLIEVEAIGTGCNTQSLVTEAKRLREGKVKEAAQKGPEYEFDQCWCVFDRDSFPADAFNNAIQQAKAADFQVAYTNEAFELWYLLHYDYHDAALDRGGYRERLNKKLGRSYQKNDPSLYGLLESRQEQAIKNAQLLQERYPIHNPQSDNPYTTVHELVIALRANSFSP